MIQSNFLVLLAAAAVPMIMGMLWYSPLLFAKVWMKEANITVGEMKPAKFALILSTAFLFSLMIASTLQFVVIHQMSYAVPLYSSEHYNLCCQLLLDRKTDAF